MVCKGGLKALVQQPGITACCLTLPLSLSHQLLVPGTLHTVLTVMREPNRFYLQLHGQVPPTHSDHPAPYFCSSQSKARNTPTFSWGLRGLHPLKISATPPASTIAGGSSLAFLPLHSLPRAAARGLFLKGKADLVPSLPKFFHERCQEQ